MRFIENRIGVICRELERLRYVRTMSLHHIVYKKGLFFTPQEAQDDARQWEDFDSSSMHWYGPDAHYWFQCEASIPSEMEGKTVCLKVSTHIEHWDYAKNPQFLLFVDGVAKQGLDLNHQTIVLTKCAEPGRTYRIDLQAYTGVMFAELRFSMEFVEFDERVNRLYYDLETPRRALSRMDENDRVQKELVAVMNETINRLDLRAPYSDAFYASVDEATRYIEKTLYEEMAGYQDVIATCIGHTHIDVAWLWTVEQTKEKVARSFSTVLQLMEEFPEYRFMSSQPALYQFLKERHPDIYEKVKARVREKRWEPEGGMWVEADCNLTGGESLVRQFYYGKKFFKDEFGVESKILWLPDVFGYSGALPQIMKRSGIEYFMTTKLAWNQINKVPYDTMMWRGIDGSEILTHLITTLGVGQSEKDYFTTYNGMLHPDAIIGGWRRYQNKDINNDILVAYGYGDGGGGPTRDMLETSGRMEKGIKGIPAVRQAFAGTYFRELEKRVSGHKRLPVWEGELYFEYHRGTYTSMGRNKRANRRCEQMLMDVELLQVLTDTARPGDAAGQKEREELEKIWKMVLLNQFHDILPGSSIAAVYEVTKQEYAYIEDRLQDWICEKLERLTKKEDKTVTIFNTLGFNRSDVVCLGQVPGGMLRDENDRLYPIQQTSDGAVAYVEHVPSKGGRTFAIMETPADGADPFIISEREIETPFYKVVFDERGLITSIVDKECSREIVQNDRRANVMTMYEDKPMNYDCWDVDIYYSEKSWDVDDLQRMEWTEFGPVRATLEIDRRESRSVIKQKIHFYARSRRIDFETWIDWKEHQTLLKVHFPVDIHTDEATFDIQFGNLKRKTHTNTSWDEARFESCGHKWIDLSEGNYGVSLLNDCKYGHSVKNGDIGLTLIKSGVSPNEHADQEEHVFTYSLYPHDGRWRADTTVREAYALNQPMYVKTGRMTEAAASVVSSDHPNIVIETIKHAQSGDGTIIRLYECENSLTRARLTFESREVEKVIECDLMEEEEQEILSEPHSCCITVKPYEIKTYKILWKDWSISG